MIFLTDYGRRWLATGLLTMGLILSSATAVVADSFSGQATVVRANVLGQSVVLSDTGALPPSGGAQQTSLLTANVPGLLSADVLHASTIGQGNRTSSEASVADLGLAVGGNTVSATFLMARAQATCTNNQPSVAGTSQIVGLVVNGQAISVSGAPNQTVALPNGRIIINEQSGSVSGHSGTITVNALHVVVNGTADIIISSAHADITCTGSNCQNTTDFVTGGGFIFTQSGARANFGVAGGIKNGAFWGHLEYIDHGTSMNVHGTGVTAYTITGLNTRHIEGTATVNGQAGYRYAVDVTDNGEPGSNDTFAIRLSNGYTAGGTLGGGNIEIHKANCQL